MSSQPLGGTNPSQKRKLLSTSTPKRKKIQPNNVQNLCKFLSDKNVPSVVRKKNNSVNSTFLSDKISQINQTFLFMLATSKEMAFVQPVIIKIDETSLEDKEFIKCRIDGSYFVGRVVATSNTLSKLESTISDVVDKFAVGWKANLLKKDMLIMCCTTIVKIQDIEESDQRIQFLSTILPAASNITVNLNSTALDKDASSSSFWGDLSSVVQESDSGLVQSENEASLGIENTGESLHHNSGSLDVDSSSNINMIEGEEDEDEDITPDVHDVSSASDDELSVNNENECKRKRRKRLITTTQLITKLRQEQKQGLLKANSEITSLTSMLDEAMPTLPIENPLTPILKKICKFIQALNFKFNNMNEKAIADGTIALDRTIKVSKVKDKEEISINGIMNFPLSLYGWSITASEPRLVMSRLMRVCIPDSLKNGSQVSDEANEKNFIYRIGDESLNGTDRLENGREKIQTLIELCHSVKNFDCMTFQSYNACKAQIIKALYDFNRAKQKKTALPTTRKSKKQKALESGLSVSNQSKETEDNENAVVNYLFKTMHSQS